MKWITIEEIDNEGRKTKVFEVSSIYEQCSLGIIKWKANWRKYAFFPYEHTCYEWDCMGDIAEFCKAETKRYKELWLRA